MIRPPFLKPGDTVGIVAPAGCLAEPEITESVDIIRSWQLEVAYGKYLFNRRSSFAGTDRQRATDFQQMLNNRNIKTILCARGGYGTIRMIDKLNFASFLKHPKWIAGFSDITVLHACLQQCLGVESLHGAMPRVAPPGKPDLASMDSLRAFLFGEISQYTLQPHHLNIPGKAKGVLVGGNLSVLYSLAGSCFDPDTRGKILFLEDLNEYLYHVDRMVMSLKIREKLKGLSGLIIGNMTGMKATSFRKPAYEIILDAVAGYGYPILFGFPAGHARPNYTLPLGREVKLTVTPDMSRLDFK